MMKRSGAVSIACRIGIGLLVLPIGLLPSAARAQSADLVLCDRLAADPTDPDKPADVRGVTISLRPMSRPRSNTAASRRPRRAARSISSAAPTPPINNCRKRIAAYRKAADKGSTTAMVELGVMLATGTGVAKDEAQARKLFERAAEAGNPRGATNLMALSARRRTGGSRQGPRLARDARRRRIRRRRSISSG